MSITHVGLPPIAIPGLWPYGAGQCWPAPRHAVYMRQRWDQPWEFVPYLMAESATERVLPAGSSATLVFRHGRIKPEDQTAFANWAARARHDWFVCIASTPGNLPRIPRFCGIVPGHHFEIGGKRTTGSVTIQHGDERLQAVGLEYLLDRRRLNDIRVRQGDGTAITIDRSPPFNERLDRGPALPGNRSAERIQEGIDFPCYGFASDLDADSNPHLWSIVDAIEYLLHYTNPAADGYEPRFFFGAPSESPYNLMAYLDATYDIIRQEGRSVWNIIRHLFDRRRGFGAHVAWGIETDTASADFGLPSGDVKIRAFSCTDAPSHVEGFTFPANPHVEHLVLDSGLDAKSAVATVESSNTYDEITVHGPPVVSCFSMAVAVSPHAEAEPAWTDSDETAYRGETDSVVGDKTISAEHKRRQSRYDAVYRRFRFHESWDWTDASGRSLSPTFDVDGNIQFNQTGPYWKAPRRFLDWLPIRDSADVSAEVDNPAWMKPLAIVEELDSDGEPTCHWHLVNNLSENIIAANPGLTNGKVAVLDREDAVEVTFNPKHRLGRNHFDPPTGDSIVEPVFDYERMIMTVACETDTRPSVVVQTGAPPILGPTQVPILDRKLSIFVPDAQVWVVAPGTVVGVWLDGEPHYQPIAIHQLPRDDTDRLRRIAALARVMYGRRRTSIRMTKRGLLGVSGLGRIVTSVTIGQGSHDVNSPVTERTWDFVQGTTRISTGWVDLDVQRIR